MALLTDKKTEKDLSERLSEFVQFGTVLNYMLDNGKVELSDLEKKLREFQKPEKVTSKKKKEKIKEEKVEQTEEEKEEIIFDE